MNIMLIADAPWVRNEVAAAASDPTIVLREETDPHRAVETAIEFVPDVVVVDLQVNGMGGMAVTRQLRDAALVGDILSPRIVLLLDREADRFIARRSGADAWVVKPFTPQQFRDAVAVPEGV